MSSHLPHLAVQIARFDLSMAGCYCLSSVPSTTMVGWFSSSMCRTWVIEEEEEEGEDDFLLLVDDANLEVLELFELENAESSSRMHHSDGPPKQIRQRDHAAGDARIRADYFGPNPVYLSLQFRRRCVSIVW